MRKNVLAVAVFFMAACCSAQVPDYIYEDLRVASVKETKVNSQLTKVETFNSQDMLLMEAYFKNEEPVGVWKKYRPGGKLYCIETYQAGTVNGWVEYYDENGRLEYRTRYRNGQRNGPYEEYYPDGKLKCKATYRPVPFLRYDFLVPKPGDYALDSLPGMASVKVGKEICYYNSGRIMAVKFYDNCHIREFDLVTYETEGRQVAYFRTTEVEVKTGKWYFYDEAGHLTDMQEYDKNKLVKGSAPDLHKEQ